MVRAKVVIRNLTGLHLRPAGILCNKAILYKSRIQFQTDHTTANAKSVLSVLGACVKGGDEIEFICEGEDEQEALDGWDAKVAQDPSITAWAQKNYFRTFVSAKKKPDGRRRGYEYLIKDRRGKIDPKTGRELIFDRSFRGDLALQYRVIA